jgi:Uma2 family endonuclease
MGEPASKLDPPLVTVDEFLRFEGEPGLRYELMDGRIVAMSPPAPRHGVVAIRLGAALSARLRAPCLPVSEAGIRLPWTDRRFHVADVAVSCSPLGDEQWCPEPRLIVEVLSPTTEDKDRGAKLRDYRRLPSVDDVLLVASTEIAVEHSSRSGPFWRVQELGPGETIRLESLGLEVSVDEFYAGLSFEDPAA